MPTPMAMATTHVSHRQESAEEGVGGFGRVDTPKSANAASTRRSCAITIRKAGRSFAKRSGRWGGAT